MKIINFKSVVSIFCMLSIIPTTLISSPPWTENGYWRLKIIGTSNNSPYPVPGVEDYFMDKYGSYPKSMLWKGNENIACSGTVSIWWDHHIHYQGLHYFPPEHLTWSTLQPYFFWRFTRVVDDSTYYEPCTYGTSTDTVSSWANTSLVVGYNFSIDLWDMSIPQDSSVWVFNLVISDTPNSVGKIVATCGKDSTSVLHSSVDTAIDTLQLILTHKKYDTSSYLLPMLDYYPLSLSVLHPLFIYYLRNDSCDQARAIGSRAISVLENNLDPLPIIRINESMDVEDYRRFIRNCGK